MENEKPIRLSQTVSEVAALHPKAKEVLVRRGLDLCCGGMHPIETAARAHGVDPQALLAELNAAVQGGKEAR